jgi:hypothetical protein
MAYVSQELKAKLAPTIKAICKKYGVKASIAVRNHSTLCLNIKSGPIDFIENFIERDAGVMSGRKMATEQVAYLRKNQSLDVNVYWYKEHFTGKALKFLQEVIPAMNNGNHDNSDIQTDYFDVGWYIDVNIGRWDKPYQFTA